MPFTNKIPLGTYVQDGLRTGPVLPGENYSTTYTVEGPNSPTPTGSIKARNYQTFGTGVLQSPINTYSFTPFNGSSFSQVPYIFPTTNGPIAANTFLNLFTGNANNNPAAQLMNATTSNTPYIQFDYPRVPGVFLNYSGGGGSPAPGLSGVRIVFKGTDGYGFPIAHQYTLTDAGNPGDGVVYPTTYASPITNLAPPTGSWACNVKAFDTLTSVQILDALPADYNITGIVTNMFGLPYRCNGFSDVQTFSWAGQNLKDLTGTLTLGTWTLSTSPFYYAQGVILNPGVGQYYNAASSTASTFNGPYGVSLTANSQSDNSDYQLTGGSTLLTLLKPNPALPATYFNPGLWTALTPPTYIPYAALPVVAAASTAPGDDFQIVTWTLTNGGANLIQYADKNTPSLTTGDVRGVIRVPSGTEYYSTALWSSTLYPQPDGYQNRLEFTQYIPGADAYQNQLSASDYIIGNVANPVLGQTPAQTQQIPVLTLTDLYGQVPFSGV